MCNGLRALGRRKSVFEAAVLLLEFRIVSLLPAAAPCAPTASCLAVAAVIAYGAPPVAVIPAAAVLPAAHGKVRLGRMVAAQQVRCSTEASKCPGPASRPPLPAVPGWFKRPLRRDCLTADSAVPAAQMVEEVERARAGGAE